MTSQITPLPGGPSDPSGQPVDEKIKKDIAQAWGKMVKLYKTIEASPFFQAKDNVIRLAINIAKFVNEVKKIEIPEFIANSKLAQEGKKVQVLSLLSAGFAGYEFYQAIEKWIEAEKPWEHAAAFLGTLAVVEDIAGLPQMIIEKVALFEPSIEAASNVSSWAPWLSVVAAILSTATIALKSLQLSKTKNFEKNMERRCNEAVINHLSQAMAHRSQKFQERLAQASIAVDHAETADILKLFQKECKAEEPDTAKLNYLVYLIEQKGLLPDSYSGPDLRQIAVLANWQTVLNDPNLRKKLDKFTSQELAKARKARDDISLQKLIHKLRKELKEIEPENLQVLDEVSNAAYIQCLRQKDPKALERHFRVEGGPLKERVDEIWKDYQGKLKSDPVQANFELEKHVSTLKGRVKEKTDSDIWSIVASVVSLVASVIFLVLAFGLSCSPLAPVGYALFACVAAAGIAKIFYDWHSKNKFEESLGMTENKLCDKWQKKLEKLEKTRSDEKEKIEIESLKKKISAHDFRVKFRRKFKGHPLSDEDKQYAKSYNQVIDDINKWRKKHYLATSAA